MLLFVLHFHETKHCFINMEDIVVWAINITLSTLTYSFYPVLNEERKFFLLPLQHLLLSDYKNYKIINTIEYLKGVLWKMTNFSKILCTIHIKIAITNQNQKHHPPVQWVINPANNIFWRIRKVTHYNNFNLLIYNNNFLSNKTHHALLIWKGFYND